MDLDTVGKTRWNDTYVISENPNLWGDPPVPFVHTAADIFAADNAHVVLDLPVGDGRNVLPLAARFPAVVGGDASDNGLALCANRLKQAGVGNVLLQKTDIFGTSFLDDSFDGIFCCEVLGHLQNPVDALRELLRIVRPGRQVVTNLFADDEPIRTDPAMAEIAPGDYQFLERIFFRFYDEAAAREVAAKVADLAELVSIDHIDWIDPPHEGYRNYEHGHASWLLVLRKHG
ncbi:class I SAM-dependent methyltransferase [Catenuloplanes atrovinosus]|uniref:Ubiquinone/menaquinone biosynthesis C-methylase UbiE n=1 Tax=Catenuloplanes atrovinosus TaxID=137266 RepID=A0AAE3YKP8_9ACTN|nr:class I SAM-dependent methyltransferase [Catenuloplanes atrovinosus]MDR7275584.1 ubiquinone/menaquinone biosynthesis C-methylase UbiE [Catenuloplanes atrovinosus]